MRTLLLLLFTGLFSQAAIAAEDPSPADLTTKANEVYQSAKAACENGEYKKALEAYDEAIKAFTTAMKAFQKAKDQKSADNLKKRIKEIKEEKAECKKQREAQRKEKQKEKQKAPDDDASDGAAKDASGKPARDEE